jgi:exodeoxyribonuclease V alpha subunit
MLDLPLAFDIIRVLPEFARLLFVGDPYQLPPIGFGLVFHVLAGSHSVPRIELTQVHRQAQSSGVPQIAHDIRCGIVPELPPFTGAAPGVSFIEAGRGEAIERLDQVMERLVGCEDLHHSGA